MNFEDFKAVLHPKIQGTSLEGYPGYIELDPDYWGVAEGSREGG